MFTHLVEKYPDLEVCIPALDAAYAILRTCFLNGGGASDSEHIVGEFMKGYLLPRPVDAAVREKLRAAFPDDGTYLADQLQGALPAISLASQVNLLTAVATLSHALEVMVGSRAQSPFLRSARPVCVSHLGQRQFWIQCLWRLWTAR